MALNLAQGAGSSQNLLVGQPASLGCSCEAPIQAASVKAPRPTRHCFWRSQILLKDCQVTQGRTRLKPGRLAAHPVNKGSKCTAQERSIVETVISRSHKQEKGVCGGGETRGENGGQVFTPSRRELGLLAIPLLLMGTAAKAEETTSSDTETVSPTQENSSPTENATAVVPETKDALLEGGDIKVSGGTPKTGRADIGPEFRRYRAEDFSLYVPRSYENVTDVDLNPRSTLTMEQKAANRPYAARFTSPDQNAGITVVIRDATTLRLSFLQTKDITDLGSLDKAAELLLPPGAKILKSRVVEQEVDRGQDVEKVVKSLPLDIDIKLVRTYYQYEFYARGQQVALSAAAQNGKVYVVGATVPTKMWKDLAKQMRTVARSFELR